MRPEELFFSQKDLLAPSATPRLSIRWLGTAGFEIRCGKHVLLLDPYLTRASLGRCLFGHLEPNLDVLRKNTPHADAIIVGHTHFDHALDVPAIAKMTGAKVFGSRSAITLCRAAGVPDSQTKVVERAPGTKPIEAEVGPFQLKFVPSAHSRFALGRVPFPGEIDDCDAIPTRANHYRCGAVFRIEIKALGKTIVHLGSAELLPTEKAPGQVDLLLLCTAGWRSGRDVPERVIQTLSPETILLSHWDDFFQPLNHPAKALPAVGIGPLTDRLRACSRDLRVGALPLLGSVDL